MKNPRMAGYAKLGKQLISRLPGEPILDPADWQELLKLISSRRGRPPVTDSLCSRDDVPVRCWNCGGVICVQVHTRRMTYRQAPDLLAALMKSPPPAPRPADPDETRRAYMCDRRRSDDNCGKVIADRYALDAVVTEITINELSSPESMEALSQVQAQRREQRAPHEAEIQRLEGVMKYWDQQLNDGAGGMTPERHTMLVGDLKKKIAREQADLDAIGTADVSVPRAETREQIEAKWRAAGPAGQRTLLRQAFGERPIYVRPGSSLDLPAEVADRIMWQQRGPTPGDAPQGPPR